MQHRVSFCANPLPDALLHRAHGTLKIAKMESSTLGICITAMDQRKNVQISIIAAKVIT